MAETSLPDDDAQGRLSRKDTTVAFDPPIPILRVPLPATQEDDPSKGPFVLAFQDEDAWLNAWQSCEIKVAERCEAGARMGCSIGAAKRCKPPWWHKIFPFFYKPNHRYEDREACEEREMQNCLTDAKEKCTFYAKDICQGGFREARIVNSPASLDSNFQQRYRFVKRFKREEAVSLVREKGSAINEKASS